MLWHVSVILMSAAGRLYGEVYGHGRELLMILVGIIIITWSHSSQGLSFDTVQWHVSSSIEPECQPATWWRWMTHLWELCGNKLASMNCCLNYSHNIIIAVLFWTTRHWHGVVSRRQSAACGCVQSVFTWNVYAPGHPLLGHQSPGSNQTF